MTRFFKLTPEMSKNLRKSKLTASQWRLWSFLVEIDPFGDKYVDLPDTLTILDECEIGKSSFYTAIAKFQKMGLFDFQDKGFSFRNLGCQSNDVSPKNWKAVQKIGIDSEKLENLSEKLECTIYTELQNKQTLSEAEKKIETFEIPNATSSTLSVVAKTENHSSVNAIAVFEEKFSAAPKNLQQRNFNWLPDGPWNLEGKLDPEFRDFVAKDWVKRFGGDIHSKRADVLSHFKKDPANLPIRWEQYQSEYLNRYENAQTLLSNGVEIPEDYQDRLITNQRAITAQLPQELNPIAVIPDLVGNMRSLGGITKPLAIAGTAGTEQPIIKTEDGRTYQAYKKPEIENPATDEQMAEMRERIKAFTQGGRIGQHKPVVELTEEAIALEKEAKKANYLANLNEMLKDPILRKEAMKEAFKRNDLEFLFDEDGTPYQVAYAEELEF